MFIKTTIHLKTYKGILFGELCFTFLFNHLLLPNLLVDWLFPPSSTWSLTWNVLVFSNWSQCLNLLSQLATFGRYQINIFGRYHMMFNWYQCEFVYNIPIQLNLTSLPCNIQKYKKKTMGRINLYLLKTKPCRKNRAQYTLCVWK